MNVQKDSPINCKYDQGDFEHLNILYNILISTFSGAHLKRYTWQFFYHFYLRP